MSLQEIGVPRPSPSNSVGPDPSGRDSTWPRHLVRLLYLFAFVSGAAALAYQVAWAKILALTFGTSTLATSAVVGGFLAGMGVGAWAYHLVGERVEAPLRTYALIEFAIAITTATLTAGFWLLPGAFAAVAAGVPSGLAMDALRVISVLALLLTPAALMGATYPALCASIIETRSGVDRHLGMIYGLNTLGAAAGAFLAGLFFIPAVGASATVTTGNALNVCVGVSALLLFHRTKSSRSPVPHRPEETAIPTELSYRVTGTVLVVSGFATLGYEILWFRALRYLVGNSTFALTIILVVFLLGLGFGALPLRRVIARGKPEIDLARCQFGIAVLAALSIGLMALAVSSTGFAASLSIFSPWLRSLPWWSRLAIHGAFALVVMLPATFLMGLSFPLASRLFLGDARLVGRRIGGAYLLANLGSILGAVLAAVLLLPVLGTVGGTHAVVAINFLLGVMVLSALRLGERQGVRIAGLALAILVTLALLLPTQMRFRGFSATLPGEVRIEFEQENEMGTVQVLQDPKLPALKGIAIDGTIIGASGGWHPFLTSKQVLIAHLPMALDVRLRRALQIGLGSASTLEALTAYHTLEHIDAVEINPAVLRGSRFFPESRAAEDPRVRVVVEDAIHFLLRNREPYDLIISDGKQNADFSGNSKLLSREFYRLVLDRLSEVGLFVQWLPLNMLHADFRVVLRTAAETFPELEVFVHLPSSVVLVGTRQPLAGRPSSPESRFLQLRASRDLRPYGIPNLAELIRRWTTGRKGILAAVGAGPLNTWDDSPVEFAAYRAHLEEVREAPAENVRLLMEATRLGLEITGSSPFGRRNDQGDDLVWRAYLSLFERDFAEAKRLLKAALEANPHDPMARHALPSVEHLR